MQLPPGPSARLRFPQSSRLKLGREFARPRLEGQRLAVGCLVANWLALPQDSKTRLGVITSRKIGGAVERNRARRLLRESFRLHQYDFERPVDLVLVARQSIVGKNFSAVEKDFLEALRRARLLKKT
jgi:ribonuclease P protein component